MNNTNIEIDKILNFAKNILDIKKATLSHFIFHTDEICKDKILVLSKFTLDNFEKYIQVAYKKGVKGVVVDIKISDSNLIHNIPIFYSKYLHDNLNLFISHMHKKPLSGMKVIGITGTDGKTSLAHLLAQTYTLIGKKVGLISTEGNGVYPRITKSIYTTPRSDLLFNFFSSFKKESVDIIIIEASSQGLDQGRLDHINFDISIVTKISKDHLDYHKTHASYLRSKSILLKMTKKMIFINEDCKNSRKIIKMVSSEAKVNYYNTGYNVDGHKTKLFNNTATKYNLSMIYSLLKQSRMQDKEIISVFEKLKPIKGRLNIFSKKKFSKFIIDYAHTPDSIRSLLKDIHAIYSKNMNKIIIVFGCGGDRDKSKRLQMGKIADKYCDVIILTDDNPRKENPQKIIDDISRGITNKNKLFTIPKRKDAIKNSIKISQKNDIVMILGKGNEDTINYGDSSIEHNDIKYLSYLLNEN